MTHDKLKTHGKIFNPVTPVPPLPCAYGLNPRQNLNTRQTFETHNGKKVCCVPPLGTRQTDTFAVCFSLFAVSLGRSTRQTINKNVKLALKISRNTLIVYGP